MFTAAALALAVAIGGCGSSAAGTGSAALSGGDTDFLNFTHCMRAHGVQMQDPYHRAGHSGLTLSMPTPSPAEKTAYGACEHFIQAVIEMKMSHAPRIPASARLALIHYAECMRSRGIPMLDPDQFGSLNLGNVPGIANGPGRYTPPFHFADQECRHLLPAGIRDNGTGP
jgi:hypothetical protein